VAVIQEDKADKNNFPGLVEALRDATVAGQRAAAWPPQGTLEAVRAFLAAGKPLVGLADRLPRFRARGQATEGGTWGPFDPEVLGGNYTGHHGPVQKTSLRPAQAKRVIRFSTAWISNNWSATIVYTVSPLKETATPLLIGSIPTSPPSRWRGRIRSATRSAVFYTSLAIPTTSTTRHSAVAGHGISGPRQTDSTAWRGA